MELPYEKQALVFAKEVERYTSRLLSTTETLLKTEDVDIATSPKDLVFQQDKVKLYHFRAKKNELCPVPLLVTYALVNRETMMDLEEGRSLIRNLLDRGIDIYMIIWGYPSRLDRFITLDDCIDIYMNDCVDYVRKERGLEKINLMGVCQGGTFTIIYTSLYPEKVQNMVAMVAPVDFDTDDGLLNVWARYMDVDLMVDTLGNIPGDFMNLGFLMLKPFQLMVDKYIGLVESAEDPALIQNFLRMEKWIFDSPDQAGETFRKFLNEMYRKNSLFKGELEIGGRKVDLKNINMPVLNIYAEQDHLVPPSSSKPLAGLVSSQDMTTTAFPVGHIGMYVSSKSQKELSPLIADWLLARAGSVAKTKSIMEGSTTQGTVAKKAARRRPTKAT
ncbi:MAG: class III poly(R)-hydroxyalkanoic acid synthase subunit PhaC [Chloroflexi bacterium]|nr:class III poly(R)-hydroxyalkanoic acid synthase subunit PhaC [Chloroflexota bacterium]MBM4454384.1 class III poly(R)-hydroxyalkanoic acid synthase subunit PhaC [Chloroflexota bacterium]